MMAEAGVAAVALAEAGKGIRSFYGKAISFIFHTDYLIWNKSKERLTCAKFST